MALSPQSTTWESRQLNVEIVLAYEQTVIRLSWPSTVQILFQPPIPYYRSTSLNAQTYYIRVHPIPLSERMNGKRA